MDFNLVGHGTWCAAYVAVLMLHIPYINWLFSYLLSQNVCLESWEFVHSAYYGGVFSANLAMQSLGINVDFDEYPICYR
jgi:hypothetical protein